MNSNQRKEYILSILEAERSVRINELSRELKVTRETIRKDLYTLEKKGLIKKIHGGAILENHTQETDYEKRKIEKGEEKAKIAKLAVQFIEEGDTVYLDYGTTTLALAKEIIKLKNITVVTNTIPIVNLLLKNDTIDIILLGGLLRKNEVSLYGPFATNNTQDIFVNFGFFGCSGIEANAAITSHHTGEVSVSKEMIKQSQTSVVLADHSKFGMVAFNRTAYFEEIDMIISDVFAKEVKEYATILQHGVELVLAE
ncbi:DeoR/GlpR family DNA-binding transcription regulator [Enterococcus sp. LJL99]